MTNSDLTIMKADLEELVAAVGLRERTKLLGRLVLPSVRLIARPSEGRVPLGASRIGGCPDLPPGQAWPRQSDPDTQSQNWNHPHGVAEGGSLPFLAQINLVEAAPRDPDHLLPPSGTLLFFCDPNSGTWRLMFHDGDGTMLERTDFPDDLPDEKRYPKHSVEMRPEMTLPDYAYHGSYGRDERRVFFDVLNPELSQENLSDAEEKAYQELRRQLAGGEKREVHRMLGWPECVQNPMKLEIHVAAHQFIDDGTLYMAFYDAKDPRPAALKAEAEAAGWTLLLQISSLYSEPGMIWGDGGTHYLWIRRDDLAQADFSRVRYELQMG